jgi:CBS domain-containing protein
VTASPDEEPQVTDVASSVVGVFHLVNSLLPDQQNVVSISPGTPVREALKLMRKYEFSQLPVMEGDLVVGVFSYRSFAARAAELGRLDVERLEVDDFLEDFEFIRVTSELEVMFQFLDRDGAVLVGDPDRLVSVATATDLIKYLYGVAHPFVLVQEIELVLRALVHTSVSEEELARCIRRAIAGKYPGAEDRIPRRLVDLTLSDLVQTVIYGTNYTDEFARFLGRNRDSARGYLSPIPELRNVIVHFRRAITGADLETLANTRTWLLRKARAVEARGGVRL